MMLALAQRRSVSSRIASFFRPGATLKTNIIGVTQRKQFFASGSQTEVNTENERDIFIFGNPTEAPSGTDNANGNVYKTFVDMGVCPQLVIALRKTNKTIPTIIQKASYDSIVAKKDVVICAETGSGKTLSYLLPVLQQYYTDNVDRGAVHSDINKEGGGGGGGGGFKYPSTIILVPNKDLMQQVHAMTEEILQHSNTVRFPAVAASEIDAGSCNNGAMSVRVSSGCMERVDGHWPYRGVPEEPLTHSPDILVCTPAFLGAFIKGPKILEEEFFYSIKRCIIDEADMLLEGSYKQDMEKIFDVFKVLRRRTMKKLDLKPHERVVQFVLSAATISTHGKYSVDQYLQKRFPRAERLLSSSFHKHHPRIAQDFLHVDFLQQSEHSASSESYLSSQQHPGRNEEWEGGDRPSTVSVMTTARVELVFRALIDALPPRDEEDGDEDDMGILSSPTSSAGEWHRDQWKERFNLHPVASADDSEIENMSSFAAQLPPTMIFANTAGKARDLARALEDYEGGILAGRVAEFHKLVPTYEKQEALEKFRQHSVSGVKILVCTDAAARGLDLPDVEHVIQAEFALNVVQHLHRNGRASRAGRKGRATIIFDDSAIDLVQSLMSEDEGAEGGNERRIDASFSRRRGFRRNVNRKLRRKQELSQSFRHRDNK